MNAGRIWIAQNPGDRSFIQSGKRAANVTHASRWPLGPGQRGTVEPKSMAIPNHPRCARVSRPRTWTTAGLSRFRGDLRSSEAAGSGDPRRARYDVDRGEVECCVPREATNCPVASEYSGKWCFAPSYDLRRLSRGVEPFAKVPLAGFGVGDESADGPRMITITGSSPAQASLGDVTHRLQCQTMARASSMVSSSVDFLIATELERSSL